MGSTALSVTAARGYRAGHRWAAWAALLIGVASAPQATASGAHNSYTIPGMAESVDLERYPVSRLQIGIIGQAKRNTGRRTGVDQVAGLELLPSGCHTEPWGN